NDKNRHVLAWGYGKNPTDKGFGTFTHSFDLETLQFASEVKPANYAARLHEFGPWSVGYKFDYNLSVVEVKSKANNSAVTLSSHKISAFTLVPRDEQVPLVAFDYYRKVRLADAATGKLVKDSDREFAYVLDLAPSPDARYLAVATGTQHISIL